MPIGRCSFPALLAADALLGAPAADAFCGFYVGSAGATLYNQASQVAIARVGDRTTITMRNDYKGPPKDFALIVPVPVVLGESDVTTVPGELFDRLDSYSAPRLVEYREKDPCWRPNPRKFAMRSRSVKSESPDLGVTVEAEFSVEEYDIQILSATESDGLEAWLKQEGYKIPKGAARILAPYIKEQVKFFAAKVDSTKLKRTDDGGIVLSPLQFGFNAPTFGLPIRLGMINAKGVQDLIIYALTPSGMRTAVTNYPNPFIPTDIELGRKIPKQKKGESEADAFARYYVSLFNTAQDKAGGAAVLTEYAWDSSSCDPCPTTPLQPNEMEQLGIPGGYGVVTRLHARYTNKLFKDDLQLAVTKHDQNFQGRYILRRPWKGAVRCKDPQRGMYEDTINPMIGRMSRVRSAPITIGRRRGPGLFAPPPPKTPAKLSKNDVLKVLKTRMDAINRCFEHGGTERLRMQWRITADGSTTGVKVLSASYRRTKTGDCFTKLIVDTRFPKNDGSLPPIEFPFSPKKR